MPHTDADIVPKSKTVNPPSPPSPSPEAVEPAQPEPAAPRRLLDTTGQSSGADEWFPDYEAGSPWTKEEEKPILFEQTNDFQPVASEPEAESEISPQPEPEQQLEQLSHAAENNEATEGFEAEPPAQIESTQKPITDVPHEAEEPDQGIIEAEPPAHTESTQGAITDVLHEAEEPDQGIIEAEPPAQTELTQEAITDVLDEAAKPDQESIEPALVADIQPAQEEKASDGEPKVPSGPAHMSKDSFARTVSEQPNLDDDDEPWSPPRAHPDLFKFMPPNSRTNSFPVVPQMDHQQQHGHIKQLSTNQAEDIVNEVEQESENFEFEDTSTAHASSALQHDNFWGDDDDAEAAFPAQLGGDIHSPAEEASDARYAEGLPLISHNQADGALEHGEIKAHDPFAEDGIGEEEDFFAQIGGSSEAPDLQEFNPAPLDRKSTMQVLQGLSGDGANGPDGKLESPDEQDEDELLDDSPVIEQPAEPLLGGSTTAAESIAPEPQEKQGEDIAAKWSEAFGEDEDDGFLLEDNPAQDNQEGDSFDPSAFLIDDDEGFLEDDEPAPQIAPVQPAQPTGVSNKYAPVVAAQPAISRQPSNPYFPSASPIIPQSQFGAPVPPVAASLYGVPPAQPPTTTPYGAPPARPGVIKGQSFADKSKGGYQSPYDLPMEVVKPRKRQSTQQPRGGPSAPPGPPIVTRNSSMGPPAMSGPPGQIPSPHVTPQLQSTGSFASPPASNHSGQSPSLAKPPQQAGSRTGFFEELPMSSKARPGSRTSNKSQPSPMQATFNGPPQAIQPSPLSMPTPPNEPAFNAPSVTTDFPRLVPPAPTNPYATLPAAAANSAPSVLPPAASRYSPASTQGPAANGGIPPPSRYSPAPPAQRVASYGPNATVQPAALPHLPRTSSPLAHFEARPVASHGEPPASQLSRVASSVYEPRLNRVTSLPPTREVEEEDLPVDQSTGASAPTSAPNSQFPPRGRQNAPQPLDSDIHNMSPPKRRISYGPVPPGTGLDIEPPARSQTGSPGAMYGLRSPIKASEAAGRPSSAQGHMAPSLTRALTQPDSTSLTNTRPRGFSQKLNLIPPTDGRELDVLQRWKGVPLISWGVGGTLVTSFPVDVPRYGMNQVAPMIIRSPGEIKVKTIKDVQPLEERLAKFPGPLKGKSKKKETVAWLTAGIEELEKGLPNPAFQTQVPHDDKRVVERVLLWKILRVMIENDGTLDGNPTVDKTVRDILTYGSSQNDVTSPMFASGAGLGGFAGESSATQMQPDSVDSGTIQRLKRSLLAGEREKAVWDAADKRLWGHALLIANTVSPDLYHKVSQEFIKKEVNFPGHNNESLAALYSVLSGNHEESVDELVPVHARAGVQMLATSTGPTAGTGMDGLEKWRETLTLILSNRSTGDVQAVNSLGNLLSGYGRAEAAHICFLFARSATVFGGLDDPRAQFVLVGADHRTQSEQFFKDTESLLLSEVYEYGLSLIGTPSLANGVPHLTVYKLQHAMTLAEHGFRDKALQYCELILKDMSAQTRRSPYHHPVLEAAVEDLRQKLLQAPSKEGSNSWISKPSMDKVSSSVWSRFNKFVAGDEIDAPGQGSPKNGDEAGPFAGLQGGTPTVSRPPSAAGTTGMDMFSTPNGYLGAPSVAPTTSPVLTRTASRYAPASAPSPAAASPYNPTPSYTTSARSSMERTSGEYSRGPYEPRRSSDLATGPTGGYLPGHGASSDAALGISNNGSYQPAPPAMNATATAPPTSSPQTPTFSPYSPHSQQSPYAPAAETASPYAPAAVVADAKPAVGHGQGYGYEPPSFGTVGSQPPEPVEEQASGGGYDPPSSNSYEPPSYGYEPPSYQPDAETGNEREDEPRPKKSFMDDDDDNFPSVTATQSGDKSKSQKDKENEELFRKAAEEDGKFTNWSFLPQSSALLTITQQNELRKKKKQRARRDGVSEAGLVVPRKSLLTAPRPTNPSVPNLARSPASSTTPIRSAGSTRPPAPKTRHQRRPAHHPLPAAWPVPPRPGLRRPARRRQPPA